MAVKQTCPTVIFGQLELALRDNDFAEAGRLRLILASMGVQVRIDLWPPAEIEKNVHGVNRNGQGSVR